MLLYKQSDQYGNEATFLLLIIKKDVIMSPNFFYFDLDFSKIHFQIFKFELSFYLNKEKKILKKTSLDISF